MRSVIRAAILTGLCGLIQAHDFWIEPSAFHVESGQPVALRFRVGEHFRGEEVPRDPRRIILFQYYGPEKSGPIPGMAGLKPAGVLETESPGLHLVAYHSASSFVQLEADKFEEYLRQEGLERIIEQRKKLGESRKGGREFFARCVKSLLFVGSGGSSRGFDRVLGFPVELVPENNPYLLEGGGKFAVRMLREGKPLKGALVVAYPDADPSQPLKARTDGDGRVSFSLDRPGPWLIKAVHMERIENDEADWQSWWASLTFEVP